MGPGDHVCALYSGPDELEATLAPYLAAGLAGGDKCVCVVEAEGRTAAEEGCLSIPEIYGDVSRPERIVLEASDREGRRYRKEATGLKARAIQHEIDHLDGILFLDHLSLVKRQMLLARYRREHKDDVGFIKEVQAESARSE